MSIRRFRSTGQIATPFTYTESWNYTTCANRAPHSTVYTGAYLLGYKKTMEDFVTPNWRKLKGKRFIFNGMISTETTVKIVGSSSVTLTAVSPTCTSPTLYGTDNQSGPVYVGSYLPTVAPTLTHLAPWSDSTLTNAADETWISCLENRGKGQANLLEDLAEMEKTFAMLESPAENIISLVKSLRRNGRRLRAYRKVAANSKALIIFASSEWLRFRYGIMPIVASIKAIRKAMETGYKKSPKVYTARAMKNLNKTIFINYHYADSAVTFDHRKTTSEEVSLRASFSDSYTLGPLQDLGFTFRDIVGLPWELLRYSFVLDWFVNIGDNFYANIPRPGFVELGGGVSTRNTYTTVYNATSGVTATTPSVRTVSGGLGDSLILKTVFYERYIPVSNVHIVIRNDFKLDKFIRAADALSVAIQWLNSIGFDRH